MTVGLVLTKIPFKIRSIPIVDLSVALLHSVAKTADEAISILVDDFCVSIQDSFFPVAVDSNLSGGHKVRASSMPEVILPLTLVYFFGVLIVVGALSVPLIVFESPVVAVSVRVVHGALHGSSGIEVVTFKAFSSGEEQGLLHLYLILTISIYSLQKKSELHLQQNIFGAVSSSPFEMRGNLLGGRGNLVVNIIYTP